MDTSEPDLGEALSAAAGRAERMLETCLPPAGQFQGNFEPIRSIRRLGNCMQTER